MPQKYHQIQTPDSPIPIKVQNSQSMVACYAVVTEACQSRRQIEIYYKTGKSVTYRQYIQKKVKACNIETKRSKNITKKKRKDSDDEYNVKNQKKDRNVTSNLIHHLIKFLTLTRGQEDQIKRIIQYNHLTITFQEYYQMLEQLEKNLKTYVTLKHISDLWFSDNPQKKEFCFLMRVISKLFYRKHGFCSIYYSNKFNRASKNIHNKGVRNLVEVLVHKDLEQLKNSLSISQ